MRISDLTMNFFSGINTLTKLLSVIEENMSYFQARYIQVLQEEHIEYVRLKKFISFEPNEVGRLSIFLYNDI